MANFLAFSRGCDSPSESGQLFSLFKGVRFENSLRATHGSIHNFLCSLRAVNKWNLRITARRALIRNVSLFGMETAPRQRAVWIPRHQIEPTAGAEGGGGDSQLASFDGSHFHPRVHVDVLVLQALCEGLCRDCAAAYTRGAVPSGRRRATWRTKNSKTGGSNPSISLHRSRGQRRTVQGGAVSFAVQVL